MRTPDNGFAMTTSEYGSPLCVAKIHFHDGEVAENYRNLDFEIKESLDSTALFNDVGSRPFADMIDLCVGRRADLRGVLLQCPQCQNLTCENLDCPVSAVCLR